VVVEDAEVAVVDVVVDPLLRRTSSRVKSRTLTWTLRMRDSNHHHHRHRRRHRHLTWRK
jgi:hypothetical protein